MKETFAVVGNCQAPYLADALLSNDLFSAAFELVKIPPVHTISINDLDAYFEKLRTVDHIIHQPILDEHRFGKLTSMSLRSRLADNSNLICIPSCYFDGYFPTLTNIANIKTPASGVHDMAVFHSFDIGMTIEQTVSLIYSEDCFGPLFYQRSWENGLRGLFEREKRFSADVSLSKYLASAGRESVLMFQFNHPENAVFDYLASGIFHCLGIAGRTSLRKQKLDNVRWPVFPWVCEALKISPDLDRQKLVVDGVHIEMIEFVSGSFAEYGKMSEHQRQICRSRMTPVREAIALRAGVRNFDAQWRF